MRQEYLDQQRQWELDQKAAAPKTYLPFDEEEMEQQHSECTGAGELVNCIG